MKNKKEKFVITADDVKSDYADYTESYAAYLSKHPKELQYYKKHIVEKYNKTQNEALFLSGMRTVAMAEGKMSQIAKKANIQRTSVYKMLSEDANPSFANVVHSASVLGIVPNFATV
ncbi:MAG: hypothetical protein LBN20_03670 [Endomicrobium sp.]|jgi:DNA-binding phage protein|nr:hypothetical protein [Endomicrobium sp.]